MSVDGGIVICVFVDQVDLIELLLMFVVVYDVCCVEWFVFVQVVFDCVVVVLIGVQMGDGVLLSWQGVGLILVVWIEVVVMVFCVCICFLCQVCDWGYQCMVGGSMMQQIIVVVDMVLLLFSCIVKGGCVFILVFELFDGMQCLIVNCGNIGGILVILFDFVKVLCIIVVYLILMFGDSNLIVIYVDGILGVGVGLVEVDCEELEGGSKIDVSYDGYVCCFGLIYKCMLVLLVSGCELCGEDVLFFGFKCCKFVSIVFVICFYFVFGVEIMLIVDGQVVLLCIEYGLLWQFCCCGGKLLIEESLWVDVDGCLYVSQ